jgi:hypothetical protein
VQTTPSAAIPALEFVRPWCHYRSVVNGGGNKTKRRFVGAATAAVATVALGLTVLGIASAPAATRAVPYLWQNCTHVHTKYRHGVGKVAAHDRTTGTPVTTFYRSTRLYNIAMSYNGQRGYNLDRDHDGIACEKR